MRLTVEVKSGPAAGRTASAGEHQDLRVGSAETAHLSVPSDRLLSPEHFSLTWIGGTWNLIDRRSRLGTIVNGKRVVVAEARDGDMIIAGQTRFAVRIEQQASATPLPPAPPRQRSGRDWKPNFRSDLLARVATLLREQSEPVYALVDAARDPRVRGLLLVADVQYRSLYEGEKGEAFADFAPYLVRLHAGAPLLDLLLREGWGRSWGLFLTSPEPFAAVRKHFRRFLMVESPEGEQLYFRFYDPRVLRVFLPACNAAEITDLFGPVTNFFTEAESPGTVLRFTPTGVGFNKEEITLHPYVDVEPDEPWVDGVLGGFTDLDDEERLILLHGWHAALRS